MAAEDLVEVLRRPSRGLPQWFPDRIRRRSAWTLGQLRGSGGHRTRQGRRPGRAAGRGARPGRGRGRGTGRHDCRRAAGSSSTTSGSAAPWTCSTTRGAARAPSHLDDLEGLSQVAALHPDPVGFESWLRDALRREGVPGGVTLSTVHRVKGMEWDDVVVFGVNAGILPHHLAEDEEEERRVLHVALTRCRRQVVVLADASRPSPFLAELDGTAPRRTGPVEGAGGGRAGPPASGRGPDLRPPAGAVGSATTALRGMSGGRPGGGPGPPRPGGGRPRPPGRPSPTPRPMSTLPSSRPCGHGGPSAAGGTRCRRTSCCTTGPWSPSRRPGPGRCGSCAGLTASARPSSTCTETRSWRSWRRWSTPADHRHVEHCPQAPTAAESRRSRLGDRAGPSRSGRRVDNAAGGGVDLPPMSGWSALAIFAAGLAAGAINTIVGSGSLITFPALLGLGYSARAGQRDQHRRPRPGSLSGAIGYRRELVGQRSRLLVLGVGLGGRWPHRCGPAVAPPRIGLPQRGTHPDPGRLCPRWWPSPACRSLARHPPAGDREGPRRCRPDRRRVRHRACTAGTSGRRRG